MPTQWTLDLALTTRLADNYRYDVLHGVACRFFEQPDSDHEAEHKPFAVRLGEPSPTGTRLTLAWLLDKPPPATVVPTVIRLGSQSAEVTAFRSDKKPAADLGANSTAGGRVRFRAVSPTKFRHHGHDYPLPDPYLTYSSLALSYWAHELPGVPEDVARELRRNVVAYQHNIRTQSFTWHGNRSAGFVGTVTFGLPRVCSEAGKGAFATLNEFAAIAGMGHGTTHGLGAVEIDTAAPRANGA